MKNTNIGIINMVIETNLKESYFNKGLLTEAKENTNKLLSIIKDSTILQLEHQVYNNLNGKHIENELLATRYIDNNIKLFEVYTIDEIDAENEKLKSILTINENQLSNKESIDFFNAIDILIKESVRHPNDININLQHESFGVVLKHIQKPKEKIIESDDLKMINEEVIEIAVKKFNEKYEKLNENEKQLFKKLIKASDSEKKELLESYKKDALNVLENLNKEQVKENISKAIKKINEMEYKKDNVINDIVDLHELKNELL